MGMYTQFVLHAPLKEDSVAQVQYALDAVRANCDQGKPPSHEFFSCTRADTLLHYAYIEDGTLLMVSPTGIPKNAPAPNAGKLFVEYLLTKEAAEVQVKVRGQAVIKGVRPLPGAKAMDEIKAIRPTEDEISKGIPEVKEKFRDTFGI